MSILSFMWNLHKCMGTNRTLGKHASVTVIKFKQQEGIHKPTSLISAYPTEMIKHEIWGRHTTQQYEGQEKVEQEIVTKKIKDTKKCLAAQWSKGRKWGSSTKKDWHLRDVWLCSSVNTISSSDMSEILVTWRLKFGLEDGAA